MVSYSGIISNASEYVKSGLIDKWQRWVILILLSIIQFFTLCIVPLLNGYLVRILSNPDTQAPEIDAFGKLFIDGWKMNLVTILYMIPAILIALAFGAAAILSVFAGLASGGKIADVAGLLMGGMGIFIAFLVFVLITLIMNMAYVHFARSGKLLDAFSVGEIATKISDGIGWGNYIVMWIIVWILTSILFFIISGLIIIPIVGWIASLILIPLWSVFIVKINANIYDNRD